MYTEKYYRVSVKSFLKRRWREIGSLIINVTAGILILTKVLIFYYGLIIIGTSILAYVILILRKKQQFTSSS